jgi:hypothetical protein
MKLLIAFLLFPLLSYSQHNSDSSRLLLGEQQAKEAIAAALINWNQKPFYDTLISDKETAVNIAETILFRFYGKDQIISERPYEIYLISGYWYISGTLPKGYFGGTFEIIFSSKNGQVIKLIHGK